MVAPTSFFSDYGCHVRILEEVRGLTDLGHEVELCTYHNGGDAPGVRIHRTVDVPWRKRAIVGSSKHKMYLDVALLWTTLRRARAFRPHLIHAHLHEGALIGGIVGRILNIPVVFDYQGSLSEEMVDHGFLRPGGLRYRIFGWLEHRIDRSPDIIVTSSEMAARRLRRRGLNGVEIDVIADGVDLDRFSSVGASASRGTVRDRLGIPEFASVVVFLGLLADYQGIPTLLNAANRLLAARPDAWVVIAGFPSVGRYSQIASQFADRDRILFPGRIAYEDAPALLAAADVAVAPKLTVSEANGKVLNYMAMGLPVVCSDTEINRDLLGDLGVYFAPGDDVALAKALGQSLDDLPGPAPELRDRVARLYAWPRQIRKLDRLYQRLLGDLAGEPSRFDVETLDAVASED